MSDDVTFGNRVSMFLIVLFLTSFMPLNPVSAETTIPNFTGHGSSILLELNNTDAATLNLTLQRNTTIETAIFDIIYETTADSPGTVNLDIGRDGQDEWRFGGGSSGGIGNQSMFVNGLNTTSDSLVGGAAWAVVDGFLLPKMAQVAAAEMNISFVPEMTGGFLAVGHIDEMLLDDADADGLAEPIFLKRGHTLANGSTQPHIGWSDWNATTGWGTTSWTPTCSGATDIISGEYNNDSIADIITIDWTNGVLCVHDSNGSSWSAASNITLGPELVGVDLADMDGDSDDDLVYALSDGTLNVRLWQTNAFASVINISVPATGTGGEGPGGGPGGGGTGSASPTDLVAGYFWPGVAMETVAVATQGDGRVSLWNLSAANGTHEWNSTEISFDGIEDSIEAFDADGDGDLDLYGSAPAMGTTLATFDGSNFSTNTKNTAPSLSNHTFADWNGNGSVSLVEVDSGSSDNNDLTITGELEMFTIQNGAISNTSTTSFDAHTAPRILRIGDIDGDGAPDYIVAGGENNEGVWIAGWHSVSWDLNGDGVAEAQMEGLAGDGNGGANPLYWTDMDGSFTSEVRGHLSGSSTVSDLYGTDFGNYTPAALSIGNGSLNTSLLNILYSVTFTVDINPTSGNLSSSLNRYMRAGSGSFDVEFPLFATSNGSLTLQSLSVTHIPGATNLNLPATPVLSLVNMSDQHVYFEWSGATHNNSSFIEYQVFRVDVNSPIILGIPLDSANENRYIDLAVSPNATYDYAVRAVHQNGVFSNLSNLLQVTVPAVPPPPPDVTPPALISAVKVSDVPADEGGDISVEWKFGLDDDVAYHLVFVHTAEFSNTSLFDAVSNVSATTNTTDVQSTSALLDGSGDTLTPSRLLRAGDSVWVAVVAVDDSGNLNQTVISTGPIMTRNNSARPTSLTLQIVSNEANGSDAVVRSGSPLELRATLLSEGEAMSDRQIDFTIHDDSGALSNLNATSDINGVASLSWADWSMFQSEYGPLTGTLSVTANFSEATYGVDTQTLVASTASADMQSRVTATFSVVDSALQLDSAGQATVTVRLLAANAGDQPLLNGLAVSWAIGNATAGTINSTGEVALDNQGSASMLIELLNGGEITFNIANSNDWLDLNLHSVQTDLLPPGNATVNLDDDGSNNQPTNLLAAKIECGAINWTMPSDPIQLAAEAAANSLTCTVFNENNVRVFVELDLAISVLGITFSPTTGTTFNIASNSSIELILTPEPGASLRNGTLTIEAAFTATDYVEVVNSTIITFLFTDELIHDDSEPNGVTPPSENARGDTKTTIVVVGGLGLVVALLGIIIGRKMLMADLEEEDEEQYFDPDEIKSAIRQSHEMPESRPLHEAEAMQGDVLLEDENLRGIGSGGATRAISRSVSMKQPKRVLDQASPASTLSAVLDKAQGNGNDMGDDSEDEYRGDEEWSEGGEAVSGRGDYQESYDEFDDSSEQHDDGEADLSDDPNYSVDDDGTEWWKDDEGLWWWRGPNDEDWLEYE